MTASTRGIRLLVVILLLAAPIAATSKPLQRRKRRQAQQLVNFKVTDTEKIEVSGNVEAIKPKQGTEIADEDEFWKKFMTAVTGSSFTDAPTRAPTPAPFATRPRTSP